MGCKVSSPESLVVSAVPCWALAGCSQQLSSASVRKTSISQLRGTNGLSQTVTQQNAVAWFALRKLTQ